MATRCKRVLLILGFALFSLFTARTETPQTIPVAASQPIHRPWRLVCAKMTDIAASRAGTVWGIGGENVSEFTLTRRTEGHNFRPFNVLARRAALSMSGGVWYIDMEHQVRRGTDSQLRAWSDAVGVAAREIAIGSRPLGEIMYPYGVTYILGTNVIKDTVATFGGFSEVSVENFGPVYRWNGDYHPGWKSIGGSGVSLTVDYKNAPWVVKTDHSIWRYIPDQGWERFPGLARAIAAGCGWEVLWIIGEDYKIYKNTGSGWRVIAENPPDNSKPIRLAELANKEVWVITEAKNLYAITME